MSKGDLSWNNMMLYCNLKPYEILRFSTKLNTWENIKINIAVILICKPNFNFEKDLEDTCLRIILVCTQNIKN